MKTTGILTKQTFFNYFIFNNNSTLLTDSERKKTKIATAILKCLTLGILPSIYRHFWKNRSVEVLTFRYKEIINTSVSDFKKQTVSSRSDINDNKKIPSHQILGNLHLGTILGFAQTTHTEFRTLENCQPKRLDTNNPEKFKCVITVCPLSASLSGLSGNLFLKEERTIDESLFKKTFDDNNITWHYVGKTLCDTTKVDNEDEKDDDWKVLAHGCTFPDSDLANKDLIEVAGFDPSQKDEWIRDTFAAKKQQIEEIDTKEWFKPLFSEIDKAVFSGKKTLVHCQMGQSRSATLLAAYLINRFAISSEDATLFLKSQRLAVNPNPLFKHYLGQYAEDMKAS